MKKIKILSLATLCITLSAPAQHPAVIKPLKIGDQVPDVALHTILNFPRGEARLSDFKGKLIILDFWSTGCKSCIGAFPKMDELRNDFINEIEVFAVTREPASSIDKLMLHSQVIKQTKLPMVLNDTILTQLFPHGAEPFVVWIDGQGKVVAQTEGHNTTHETISNFLKGQPIHFAQRKATDFNSRQSILLEGNGRQIGGLHYYSLLTKIYSRYSSFGVLKDTLTGDAIGIKFLNLPVRNLLFHAFVDEIERIDRIVFLMPNAEKYFMPKDAAKVDAWSAEMNYCYEIKAPQERISTIMQAELPLYLELRATIEKRKMRCLVLKRTSLRDKLASDASDTDEYMEIARKNLLLKNKNFSNLLDRITGDNINAFKNQALPLVNETGFSGVKRININIDLPVRDLTKMNQELNKYDLKLTAEDRNIRVLVIRPMKQGTLVAAQ